MTNPEQDDLVRHLLLAIVQTVVDEGDAVQLTSSEHEGVIALTLRVAAGDVSRLIGKHGQTVKSLRTVLAACSTKSQHRYTLYIQKEDVENLVSD